MKETQEFPEHGTIHVQGIDENTWCARTTTDTGTKVSGTSTGPGEAVSLVAKDDEHVCTFEWDMRVVLRELLRGSPMVLQTSHTNSTGRVCNVMYLQREHAFGATTQGALRSLREYLRSSSSFRKELICNKHEKTALEGRAYIKEKLYTGVVIRKFGCTWCAFCQRHTGRGGDPIRAVLDLEQVILKAYDTEMYSAYMRELTASTVHFASSAGQLSLHECSLETKSWDEFARRLGTGGFTVVPQQDGMWQAFLPGYTGAVANGGSIWNVLKRLHHQCSGDTSQIKWNYKPLVALELDDTTRTLLRDVLGVSVWREPSREEKKTLIEQVLASTCESESALEAPCFPGQLILKLHTDRSKIPTDELPEIVRNKLGSTPVYNVSCTVTTHRDGVCLFRQTQSSYGYMSDGKPYNCPYDETDEYTALTPWCEVAGTWREHSKNKHDAFSTFPGYAVLHQFAEEFHMLALQED